LNDVLTLRDLEAWSYPGTALAVLGHPIGHSLSPAMHNAALAALARDDPAWGGWRYFRFDVPPAELPRALELLQARRFHGVNLTVPHKVIAFGRMAEIDAAARPAGAVNTLRASPAGWHGFNTDGYGLSAALRATLGLELANATVVLLGAGGAARGAAVECLQRGCAALWIVNRTAEHLAALLAVVRPLAGKIPVHGLVASSEHGALASVGPGAILVNATSAGLRPSDPSPLALAALPRPAGIYDMIYNPPRTALLREAESLGLPGANGLSMLVHQGAKALEIWTGIPAARTAPFMQEAAEAAAKPG
jgi:shikimate dehydrogenase